MTLVLGSNEGAPWCLGPATLNHVGIRLLACTRQSAQPMGNVDLGKLGLFPPGASMQLGTDAQGLPHSALFGDRGPSRDEGIQRKRSDLGMG